MNVPVARAIVVTMLAWTCGMIAAQGALAASPNGTWLRSNGAQILVYGCGGGVGMKVVKSSNPANVGQVIMCGAKANGENKWKGDIKNLEDGNTYTGYVTLNGARSLTLQGCALAGLLCKTDTWRKLN